MQLPPHRTSPPGPTPTGDRKLTPDLARGFMLLLIAMAYAPVYLDGARASGGTGVDTAADVLATLLLDNRAFPMLAALFGYGLAMVVARRAAAGTPEAASKSLLRRRAAVLIAFGFVHAALVFPGEILGAYGVALLLLGGLLFRADRVILTAAAVLSALYVVTVMATAIVGEAAGTAEEWQIAGYTTAADWFERIVMWPFSPLYTLVAFPILVPLLIGVWAGRKELLHEPARHRALLIRTFAVGAAVSLLGAVPSVLAVVGVLDAAWTGAAMGIQTLTGVFGGIAYAALFGLIASRVEARQGPLATALAATGKRSLSAYLMLSVLIAVIMHRELLGASEHVYLAGAVGIALLCWLGAVLTCSALERAGRKGPADALLRTLVYGGSR